jgi:glycosyltransferase involved in cell wall biosynthesis
MVYCPLLGSVAFAALRKMFFREPLWVNIQDIPADAAVASDFYRSGIFRRVTAFAQKCLLNRGEVWSSISPDMVRRLEAIKTNRTPIHLCPNWLTDSLHQQIQQLSSKVGRPPQGPTRLLYCGTIGKKQGLLDFCQKLKTLDIDFHLQIHGGGGESEAVRRWVEAGGDPRFGFAGLLPESEFVRAVHGSDWFVVPEKPRAGFSFFPSKLIPCMSVGTPVLAISDRSGSLGREVTEHEVGIVVEWSELDQLPARLARYYREPSMFTTLQQNCLRRAQAYNRDHAMDRLEDLLRESYEQNDRPKVVRYSNGRRPARDRLLPTDKSASA